MNNSSLWILRIFLFLAILFSGLEKAYSYLTIYITKNGEIYGMLSVNGYDGEVWYHNWHGAYNQTTLKHEDKVLIIPAVGGG
jgi:hypothetical protein